MFKAFTGTVALVAAVGLAVVPAAAAQPVVTLTGEELTAGPASVVTFQCGSPSTMTYHATGTALGPYPGTFVEDGSVTFENGGVQSYSAQFTIDSPAGTISGTKELAPAEPGNTSSCGPVEQFPEFAQLSVVESYDATISDAFGRTFHEIGRAVSNIIASKTTAGQTSLSMSQSFRSGGTDAMTVEVSPATSFNPVGSQHTLTAIVRDALGQPIQGVTVTFTVVPSGDAGFCETDASGTCTFTYQGPDLPRADDITACADTNVNGEADPGEPCGEATKIWTMPATTPGQVTGGGFIRDSRISFAVHARAATSTDPVQGGCNVNDHIGGVRIQCLDVTTLVLTSTHATLFGTAEQDGVATNYRIDVDDLSDQGLPDTFQIQTDLGYLNGGPLTGGNIQIRSE
jgi:hypothetical protein